MAMKHFDIMDGLRTDGRTMDATSWHMLILPFGPDDLINLGTLLNTDLRVEIIL